MSLLIKNKNTDSILLFIILFVAAILRFWDYPNIPYMHDELSALGRIQFDNFSDLIRYGVYSDTHPAGIQVFLYYWCNIIGENEMFVKFPFILSGLLAIYISYQIASFMFNRTNAIITASFIAVLQFTVMYSQLERPYASGLLFSVLMVWCWCNYLFNVNTKKIKWLIGYIISSAFCAYNHHVTLLFTAIVGLTGLLFINKKNWIAYVLSGISIFLLYIPHLNIFFYQLNIGGIGNEGGWLAKPGHDWIFTFLRYVFHYSYWLYFIVISLVITGFFIYKNEVSKYLRYRIICFCWFFVLFAICYFYSLWVNPIIQFSTLIFVFPFMLMFLFSYFPDIQNKFKIIITVIILTAGILTLVFERKHFLIFYKQPYNEYVKNTYKYLDEIGDESKVTIEHTVPEYPIKYYFKKYDRKFNCILYDQIESKPNPKTFRQFVNGLKTDYFIFGNPPLEYIPIIKEKYPYLIKKENGFTYTLYCFARHKPIYEIKENHIFSMNLNMKKILKQEKKNISFLKTDTEKKSYIIDSTEEFSKAISFKLKDFIKCNHIIFNMSANITVEDTSANPLLVLDIHTRDSSIIWNGSEYKKYNNIINGSNTVYFSQILSDIILKDYPDAELKIYIWNNTKDIIYVNNFSIEVNECNPYIYGLYKEF